MMSNQVQVLYLPKTLENWPWPRAINPHYEEVKAESSAWFRSFHAFSAQSQYAFDKCDFSLLAALVYPWATKEHLRTGCDLMNVFFVIDEYTDVEHKPVVREMVDIVIDAMKYPHKPRPQGEVVLGEIIRQFWERGVKSASPTSQGHMVESFVGYLEAVVQEAADRDNETIRSIDSYFETRRGTVGARPAYVPAELHLNLPDDVFYHPVMVELTAHITDLIILDNDVLSYNREQATSDSRHNILTVVMHQCKTDLEGAIAWVVKTHIEVETKFLDGLKRVPSWGIDMDRQVQQYLRGIANWVRGNVCWSFEGGRYFGNKGLEYQKTRLVPLLPKVVFERRHLSLRRENVAVSHMEALEAKTTLSSPLC